MSKKENNNNVGGWKPSTVILYPFTRNAKTYANINDVLPSSAFPNAICIVLRKTMIVTDAPYLIYYNRVAEKQETENDMFKE